MNNQEVKGNSITFVPDYSNKRFGDTAIYFSYYPASKGNKVLILTVNGVTATTTVPGLRQ